MNDMNAEWVVVDVTVDVKNPELDVSDANVEVLFIVWRGCYFSAGSFVNLYE